MKILKPHFVPHPAYETLNEWLYLYPFIDPREMLVLSIDGVSVKFVMDWAYLDFEGKRPIFRTEITLRRGAEGRRYRQPFYISSGTATPDTSPEGTAWPFSFLWPEEECDRVFPNENLPDGWIGKHFYHSGKEAHIGHNKDRKFLPPALEIACETIAILHRKGKINPLLTSQRVG